VDETSTSSNSPLKGRHSPLPLAEWTSSPERNGVAGFREKTPATADFYSSETNPVQQTVNISFADFLSAAFRVGYHSSPRQIGFERWASFSAARRSSDQHDGISRADTDSPIGGLGICGHGGGDSDRHDLRSEVRSLFQTDVQGRRLDTGQGQGHKQTQGRESRGREKTPRSGSASMSSSSNRERKVRMRVPRNSPPNPLNAGASSSSPIPLARIISASTEGIVSPRHSDRSTTHFVNGSDGQTSRFLFGSSFQAPRSFADFTGMGVVGVGVGMAATRGNCTLPRGSVDSTVTHSSAAFAPYSHPSFEDYSANSTAPATFAPLEAETMANLGTSCFCPTQQNLPPVPPYPTQSPLQCPAKNFSSIYTLPLPAAPFSAEGKVNASSFLSQPFGLGGEHDRATGGGFESRGVTETSSDPAQSQNESLRDALDCYRKKMDFSLREVFTDFESLLGAQKSESVDQSADDSADGGLKDSEENALGLVVATLLRNAAARMLETNLSDRSESPHIFPCDATDSPYLELLRECFRSLDIDRDGFLSLSDFTEEGETTEGGRTGQREEEDGSEEKSEVRGESLPALEVSPSWTQNSDVSSSIALQNKVQAALLTL
jgi:hypothetical protein